MHRYKQQTLIGTRIPVTLKEKLSKYCLTNGIKINYFIAQAIKERLKNPQSVSKEEVDALKIIREGNKEYRKGKLKPIKSLSDLDK
jgi:hypothetical protein